MNDLQQEQTLNMCEMCNCEFDVAYRYLQACNWYTEEAISMYFETGGCIEFLPQHVTTDEKEVRKEGPDATFLCQHFEGNIKALDASTMVYKEECAYCFHSWNEEGGMDVCMSCFLGFCHDGEAHMYLHSAKCHHPIYMHIERIRLEEEVDHTNKLTKLAIGTEGGYRKESNQYTTSLSMFCSDCNCRFELDDYWSRIGNQLLLCLSGEKEKEIDLWEEGALQPCPHSEEYQLPNPLPIVDCAHSKCADCSLAANLWLCLECGAFHCGRQQWGLSDLPGNGHAVQHAKDTGHSLVVKLSSLQTNHADVHCYKCDEDAKYNYGDILFPPLVSVLTQMGILKDGRIAGLHSESREKSLAERNLLVNSEFEFSMNDDQGSAYPVYCGTNSCGLDNLGNSCYLNAILQALLHLPSFQQFVNSQWSDHVQTCPASPISCVICQLMKLIVFMQRSTGQQHVAPTLFRQALMQHLPDFRNAKQQDCYEFFCCFLDELSKTSTPRQLFSIPAHYEMTCGQCSQTSRSGMEEENCLTIQIAEDEANRSFQDRVNEVFEGESIQHHCDSCKQDCAAARTWKVDGYPAILCIRMNRFILDMQSFSITKNTMQIEPEESISVGEEKQPYRLRSMCLHRGSKADFGHYVCVYKDIKNSEWIMCNDSKVVVASHPPIGECYLLFYEKCNYTCLFEYYHNHVFKRDLKGDDRTTMGPRNRCLLSHMLYHVIIVIFFLSYSCMYKYGLTLIANSVDSHKTEFIISNRHKFVKKDIARLAYSKQPHHPEWLYQQLNNCSVIYYNDRGAGLGNYIRGLITVYTISVIKECSFHIKWNAYQSAFESLLPDLIINGDEYKTLPNIAFYTGLPHHRYISDSTVFDSMIGSNKTVSIMNDYDFLPQLLQRYHPIAQFRKLGLISNQSGSGQQTVISIRSSIFRLLLSLREEICQSVKSFYQPYEQQHLVCFQIRVGGQIANHKEKAQFLEESDLKSFIFNFDSYKKRYKIADSEVNLFVTSDSDIMMDRLSRYYNHSSTKLLVFPNSTRGHSSSNAIARHKSNSTYVSVLKEMMMMTYCNHLTVTMYSSFGDVACQLGEPCDYVGYRRIKATSCDLYSTYEETKRRRHSSHTVNRVVKDSGKALSISIE